MQMVSSPDSPESLVKELREGLGWPLVRAAQVVIQAYNQALEACGLTFRSFAVLAYAGSGKGKTQLAIAHGVGLDKTTLVATLDELERRRIVRRMPDPEDRRARIVGITDEGRALLEKASAIVAEVENRLCACSPHGDTSALTSALLALIDGPLCSCTGSCC